MSLESLALERLRDEIELLRIDINNLHKSLIDCVIVLCYWNSKADMNITMEDIKNSFGLIHDEDS